jgi:hypothetical protein
MHAASSHGALTRAGGDPSYRRGVFGDVVQFLGARLSTIGRFVVAEEREPSPAMRWVVRAVDIAANLAFLTLVLVVLWRGLTWLWRLTTSATVEQGVWQTLEREPRSALMLVFLALVAVAAVALVIEVLFRVRAVAGPTKLLALFGIYQVGDTVWDVIFDWRDTSWQRIAEGLLE